MNHVAINVSISPHQKRVLLIKYIISPSRASSGKNCHMDSYGQNICVLIESIVG